MKKESKNWSKWQEGQEESGSKTSGYLRVKRFAVGGCVSRERLEKARGSP